MTTSSTQPTLNEVLDDWSLTTSDAGYGKKHIKRDGFVLFTGNSAEVWQWLRDTYRLPQLSLSEQRSEEYKAAIAETNNSLDAYWAGSCSASVARDYSAGRTVDHWI